MVQCIVELGSSRNCVQATIKKYDNLWLHSVTIIEQFSNFKVTYIMMFTVVDIVQEARH